jgi:hypothetical protein
LGRPSAGAAFAGNLSLTWQPLRVMPNGPAARRRLLLKMEDSTSRFRRVERHDVPAIMRLLAADPLGSTREAANGDQLPDAYWRAFQAIGADPH